ncbi:MAG TPA: hypothetical protein PLB87_09955 [Prolixibacteraceae bacterium]|nr:hypothetical protein [Prolixibacteraceae bacterium]
MRNVSFNHDSTNFPLKGQHRSVECRLCHPTLLFAEAKKECADCHTDIHQNTVGHDCDRCHTNESFVVTNITQIHQESRFPLYGAHKTADCSSCHSSESNLQFKPLGVECVDCHRDKYLATTNPNHQLAGYSTNCYECHNISAFDWSGSGFDHDFFPLTLGHASLECKDCHGEGYATKLSATCFDCHEYDYDITTEPNHKASGFSTECTECHTTNPGWQPATYKLHDQNNFPIYSGSHKGKWESCIICHPNGTSSFTCLDCHEHNKTSMDNRHKGRSGYAYESSACYSCHPNGRE